MTAPSASGPSRRAKLAVLSVSAAEGDKEEELAWSENELDDMVDDDDDVRAMDKGKKEVLPFGAHVAFRLPGRSRGVARLFQYRLQPNHNCEHELSLDARFSRQELPDYPLAPGQRSAAVYSI